MFIALGFKESKCSNHRTSKCQMYSKTRPSHPPSPICAKAPPTFSSEIDESQMEPGPHPLSLLHWLFLFTLYSKFWSLFSLHFYFQRPYLFSSSPRPPTTEDSHICISRSHLTSYSSAYLTSQRHSQLHLKICLHHLSLKPAFLSSFLHLSKWAFQWPS